MSTNVNNLPRIPDSEFEERMSRLKQKMAKDSIDLLVVFSNLLDPGHVRYLSDVSAINESAAVVVPLEGEPILCSGQACQFWSEHKSRIKKIRILPEVGEVAGTEYEVGQQFSSADLFAEIKSKYSIRKIGIVGTLIFPQFIYKQLAETFPGVEIVNAESMMFELRVIKSPNEIECMRAASGILDNAFAKLVDKVKVGWTELDIHAEIVAEVLRGGAESTAAAWDPMICAGPNTLLCMNRSSNRKVQESEMICLQAGAVFEGLNGTLCTPLVLGKISDEIKKAVAVSIEAKSAIMDNLKPGITTKQVNDAGRGVLEKNGYGSNSPYGMVHTIGHLECESPWLPVDKDFELREGMTVATDVFFFRMPWGSFRLEDTVAIGKNGPDRLTEFNDKFVKAYFS